MEAVNQVAVIMPVYKAHDTIKATLHSIAMQHGITYKCYLVVDGEEQGTYDYLKEAFDMEMDIIYQEVNAGPGVARQRGIDSSVEPFISFIDADDTYISSLALYYQHKPFNEEKTAMVSCDFIQENKDHSARLRERDMVWMHGKMYRREFLDKYNIRFNETRANEDVGFNTQCQCFANENEQVYLSHDVTYMWQWRDGSTVRTDNQSYAFNESISGYVENKLYAFDQVLSQKEIDDPLRYFMLKGLTHLFKKYLLAMIQKDKTARQIKKSVNHVQKWARKYYKKVYPLVGEEYIEKAEKTVLAQTGLDKLEHYEQYKLWQKQLTGEKTHKGKR